MIVRSKARREPDDTSEPISDVLFHKGLEPCGSFPTGRASTRQRNQVGPRFRVTPVSRVTRVRRSPMPSSPGATSAGIALPGSNGSIIAAAKSLSFDW